MPLNEVLDPAEKNVSSDPDPRLLPILDGGGLTHTSLPSLAPLLIVTGPGPPTPSPRVLALPTALVNSSSKSVRLVVLLNELLLLGPITRGSPG